MKSSSLVIVCLLVSIVFVHYARTSRAKREINWDGNNWAMGCDLPGNDITSFQIPREDCGEKCAQTSGCTHFAWNPWTGGTCWLKKGEATKENAVEQEDKTVMCGVIEGNTDTGDDNGDK
jgi:hypothetical protein